METQKYSVVLFQQNGNKVYLSHKGRSEWSKRTAQKHLNDVKNDVRFTDHYVLFTLEEVC